MPASIHAWGRTPETRPGHDPQGAASLRTLPCRKRRSRCRVLEPTAAQAQAASSPTLYEDRPLVKMVQAIFAFPPLFSLAAAAARRKIAQRGRDIGVDMDRHVTELRRHNWEAERRQIEDCGLTYPSYYTQPFHAYRDGNLCWEAALQADAAAASVHATVMDPQSKALDPEGDAAMRASFSSAVAAGAAALDSTAWPPGRALDIGCATGLSAVELARAAPGASIIAVDLSPHFLAVARFHQRQRERGAQQLERIEFRHAAAEATGLAPASQDLVSVCLVLHEVPQAAAAALLREAFRVLRPGGLLAIMEMNPAATGFQRIFANPFAYAAFKSTEPWLLEYITLDLHAALRDVGFGRTVQADNTPKHFSLVAEKPA